MEVAERPVDVRFATTGVKRRPEYMTLEMKLLEERMEGYKDGHQNGLQEGHNQLILSMLKNGMSPEEISKNCDLPLSAVLSVQEKETLPV